MVGININRATNSLTSTAFLTSAVLVVVGALFAQLAVLFMTENVHDVGQRGGDALYAVLAAFAVLVVLPGQYSRPIALGSSATAIQVILDDFGVV